MLLRVDDAIVVKSDRYTFMTCHDKGFTRFPGGNEGNYYKPVRYSGPFNEIKYSLDKEDANISNDLFELIRLEYEMMYFLLVDFSCSSDDEYEIFGSFIKFDIDYYVNKYKTYKTYYPKLGPSLYMAWICHLREGICGQTEFCNVQDILENMKLFKDKVSNDFDVEFRFNGKYPVDLS